MIILLSNDDGIDAEGLAAMYRALDQGFPGARVFTVAPAEPMSQVGHRVTTHEPIAFESRGERAWAVYGTPADCVRLAIFRLLDESPDWVFSGINHGGNMGQDIFISGTVAAAREAAYHGVRSAAFSHYMRRGLRLDWDVAAERTARMISRPCFSVLEPGEYWNVNLPHLNGDAGPVSFADAHAEPAPIPVVFDGAEGSARYCGVYSERPRSAGSDVEVCFGGRISRTKLRITSG